MMQGWAEQLKRIAEQGVALENGERRYCKVGNKDIAIIFIS